MSILPQFGKAALLGSAAFLAASASAVAEQAPQTAQQPPTVTERVTDALKTVIGDPVAKADVDMQRVLKATADLGQKPIEKLSPEEARRQPTPGDGAKALLLKEGKDTSPEPGVKVQELVIPGPKDPILARVYAPEGQAEGQKLPVVVYYHGGGWVIADLETYDAAPRAMARQAKALVISAHYRQAPESKFPAAHEDAFAAYQWVLKNAQQFGGDPARVAVMGESAGGNLALNVAIAARDQKVQPPVHAVLVYPVAGVDMQTQSYKDNDDAKPLNKAMMGWFMGHVLRSDQDKQDPRLDLIGKADLAGLPPTTIVTAEIDPLRSDGLMLADRLKQSGVMVTARDYPGVTHEFFGLGVAVAKAKDAQAFVAQQLTQAFGQK